MMITTGSLPRKPHNKDNRTWPKHSKVVFSWLIVKTVSIVWIMLIKINHRYTFFPAVWEGRSEAGNFAQKHDTELIKEDKRKEVETEIRVQVDEIMRQELKNLKLVSAENAMTIPTPMAYAYDNGYTYAYG